MISLERLQARLEERGLSANAASQAAGFGRDYVRDLLRGKVKDPSFSRLLRLAEVLKCSTEFLTGESNEVGNYPDFKQLSRTLLIPVAMRIRPGYFEAGASEVKEPFDWNVGSIGLVQHYERLAYVERGPTVGIELPDDALLHIVALEALREGVSVLCVIKHPTAELYTHGVFKVHILEVDEDDFVELRDEGRSRARGEPRHLMHAASAFLNGQNDLGVTVIGQVAAVYRYLDDRSRTVLREKTRVGD